MYACCQLCVAMLPALAYSWQRCQLITASILEVVHVISNELLDISTYLDIRSRYFDNFKIAHPLLLLCGAIYYLF